MVEEEISNQISEDEISDRIAAMYGTATTSEEKQNVHTFLHNVATAQNTSKTSNLTAEELGMPILPVRTYQELALFCKEVADMDYFYDYFKKKAEITASTSLSRDAKLITLAVMQRREIADVTKPPMKENKGWFKKKSPAGVNPPGI